MASTRRPIARGYGPLVLRPLATAAGVRIGDEWTSSTDGQLYKVVATGAPGSQVNAWADVATSSGGVALPANEVAFGTGSGLDSDPRFTFDPATGVARLSDGSGNALAVFDTVNRAVSITDETGKPIVDVSGVAATRTVVVSDATGAPYISIDTITPGINLYRTGTVGTDVATAPGDAVGTRPLASAVPVGTIFVATDTSYVGISMVHPFDPTLRIWKALRSVRKIRATSPGGVGATLGHLGVYDPGTGVFTQATVAGQWCNAIAQQTVGAATSMSINIGLGLVSSVIYAVGISLGQQLMSDNAGLVTPYVAGAGIIPLGWSSGAGNATDTGEMTAFDW